MEEATTALIIALVFLLMLCVISLICLDRIKAYLRKVPGLKDCSCLKPPS